MEQIREVVCFSMWKKVISNVKNIVFKICVKKRNALRSRKLDYTKTLLMMCEAILLGEIRNECISEKTEVKRISEAMRC